MPVICALERNSDQPYSTKVKAVLHYWKTIIVSGGILYLSLIRDVHIFEVVPTFTGADKVVHALMYAILGGVWIWELMDQHTNRRKNIVWGLLFPILYGGIIELLQEYYFPPRTGDWWDWAADILGTIIGLLTVLLLWKKQHSSI